MLKNKKILLFTFSFIIIMIVCTFILEIDKNNLKVLKDCSKEKISEKSISMMYETEYQSGVYQESTSSTWPGDGYIYNSTLSKCENGSKLEYDEATGKVMMYANMSDRCYVYFDAKPSTLANYIKSLYTTDGENGLYLHDTDLENGARDNSLRYAGANPDNYVCFGTDAETCPEDNLYRIIGIFDNEVKIIKSSAYGQYQTALYSAASFTDTAAYTALNETYYNSLYDTWKEKITYHNWISSTINITNVTTISNNKNDYDVMFLVADPENCNPISWQTAYAWFQAEYNGDYNLKMYIGTMSVSELRYSSSPNNWTSGIFDLNSWMFNQENEGTYLYSFFTDYVRSTRNFIISNEGVLYDSSDSCVNDFLNPDYLFRNNYNVRPAFYLKSTVKYVSGNGNINSPYKIN